MLETPRVRSIYLEIQVTPIVGGAVEASPKSWPARGTTQARHHVLSEALPQPIRGFLGGVGCGTVMLKPLAVQGFRIVLQLALEGPLKFP